MSNVRRSKVGPILLACIVLGGLLANSVHAQFTQVGDRVVPNPLRDGHGSCNVATMDQVDGCDYRGFEHGASVLSPEESNSCFSACTGCCDLFGGMTEEDRAGFQATCICLEFAVVSSVAGPVGLVDALITCGAPKSLKAGVRLRRLAQTVDEALGICRNLEEYADAELEADCRVRCNDIFPPSERPTEPEQEPEPDPDPEPEEETFPDSPERFHEMIWDIPELPEGVGGGWGDFRESTTTIGLRGIWCYRGPDAPPVCGKS